MTVQQHHDARLGIDYVTVDDEPDHVEVMRNAHVRLYEATIAPGRATQFHRHNRDTLYVILAGGRFRSDEPGRQHPGTRLGRSVPLRRSLRWLVQRRLTGWLTMPGGTLLIQPHAAHPLIHRVIADRTNTGPIRMLGIELSDQQHPTAPVVEAGADLHVEHHDSRTIVYRMHLESDASTHVEAPSGAALIQLAGTLTVDHSHTITAEVTWLGAGTRAIRNATGSPAHALLVVT